MRISYACLVALAGSLLVAGCGTDASSYVKVIHASAGAPGVDVKVGSDFAAKAITYGNTTSAYAKVSAGSKVTSNVFVAGQYSKAVLSATSKFTSNQYYTIIALDKPTSLQGKILNDDNTPPKSGDFKIRVVHGSTLAGSVDVFVTDPGANINNPASPVAPVLKAFTFGTVTPYLQVPAGTYRIRVTPTGNPAVVAIDTGKAGLAIPAGGIYTAVALDPDPNAAGSMFSLLLTADQPVKGVTPTAPAQ